MMFPTLAVLVVVALRAQDADAFSIVQPQQTRTYRSRGQIQRNGASSLSEHEFDYLLQENDSVVLPSTSRRRINLASSSSNPESASPSVVLASTAAFPGAPVIEEEAAGDTTDPYANALDSQLGKIEQYQEQQSSPGSSLEDKFKSMDLQDIVLTLILPGIVVFAGARWAFNKGATRVGSSKDETLDNFARELIYHDGDFKEMELCIKDYKSKLVWMGPTKSDAMLKRYLESYAKKKVVSPQAIASLSYVFTIFKLSEEKAAKLLVQLTKEMGTDKISSAGKLLFLGTHILKSPEGVKALQPIKALIMSTYRDEAVAETLVETSQQAIAEAAYRTTVLEGGKKQKKLTSGWEVLGLSNEAATRIFEDAAEEGFMSDRETMYGGQTRKYDKKGRQIDKDGKLTDPDAAQDDDDDEEESTSNVYECGNCGFTLFVATGRESKFFGEGFKCPECGADKSEFKGRDIED